MGSTALARVPAMVNKVILHSICSLRRASREQSGQATACLACRPACSCAAREQQPHAPGCCCEALQGAQSPAHSRQHTQRKPRPLPRFTPHPSRLRRRSCWATRCPPRPSSSSVSGRCQQHKLRSCLSCVIGVHLAAGSARSPGSLVTAHLLVLHKPLTSCTPPQPTSSCAPS